MLAIASKQADLYPPFTDKYGVERVLGRGGMGTVFEARHARLGHRVAIKVLGEECRSHPELVQRFEREARAAGELSSEHAVKIFDIDQTDDGTPFMVMELLEGCDLADLVEQGGPQPVGAAVRWIIEACSALGEAHLLGIVHRDIKPSNLFLCRGTGSIKVLDFGIAKRVASEDASITLGVAPLGTPQYMSPEQIRCAKDVDVRSDIWSLGVTLYELVCGRTPFDYDIPQACIAAIVADPVPDPREFRPELDAELVAVVMRALEKDPSARYASVDELVTALLPFAEAAPELDDVVLELQAAIRKRNDELEETLSARSSGSLSTSSLASSERASLSGIVPAPLTPRKRRRGRSKVALAVAAIGFTAFIATPRSLRARFDAHAANARVPERVSQVVAKAAAIRIPNTTSFALPDVPAPSEETAAPSSAPVRTELSLSAPAPVEKAALVPPTPRPSARPAPLKVSTPVHGGISNPGF